MADITILSKDRKLLYIYIYVYMYNLIPSIDKSCILLHTLPYFAAINTILYHLVPSDYAKALKHDWLRESEFGPSQIQTRRGAAVLRPVTRKADDGDDG